jgi:DASS family divalent anion:Na+ symporter
LARLSAYFELLQFEDGEAVFRAGDPADALYVVGDGVFQVMMSDSGTGSATGIARFSRGEAFGEMGILTGETRSATVRAHGAASALRLDLPRFTEVLEREPSIALAVSAILSQRLRAANHALEERDMALGLQVEQVLASLAPVHRRQVLEASVLEAVSQGALEAIFGPDAPSVLADLSAVGVPAGARSPLALRRLRSIFEDEDGIAAVHAHAERVGWALERTGHFDDALAVFARYGPRAAFLMTVARALRVAPPIPDDQRIYWVDRVTDEEATQDPELAMARAALLGDRGDQKAASSLLQRAMGVALTARDTTASQELGAALGRLASDQAVQASVGLAAGLDAETLREGVVPPKSPRAERASRARIFAAGGGLLVASIVMHMVGASPDAVFIALLASASAFWISDLFPSSAVSLGLVVGWILLGVSDSNLAVSGFGSLDWVFVLAVLGMGAAIARSGLLFRVGLLLVRRMPRGLVWEAGVLMVTGVLLGPLLPASAGRAALTAPLALAVADALRLPPRHPAAALLGLASWIGAGPLRYLFLNASTATLLAWGLLPDDVRNQFDWIHWFVGAFPFAVFVGVLSLLMLFLVLRPPHDRDSTREDVDLQLAVLGPPSRREWSMVVVLALVVVGWFLAPALHVHVATIAILGFLAAVATRVLDKRGLQDLDVNLLVLIGVALSTAKVAASLGLDQLAAQLIGGFIQQVHATPVMFIIGVAVMTTLVRQVLGETQTILMLGLALIPVAPTLGVNPWIVVVVIISASHTWVVPTQDQAYLAAFAATEGRLYSSDQARAVGGWFILVTLIGVGVATLYWRLLGLL